MFWDVLQVPMNYAIKDDYRLKVDFAIMTSAAVCGIVYTLLTLAKTGMPLRL